MKLITDSEDLEKIFLRLLEKYSKYYWLTAWASAESKPFIKLIENKGNILKIIVGIHFYQTHPDFIESFLETPSVRYIKQPEGTYHPKIYLFYNSRKDWELLVGSANFTNAAFTVNTEISTLIDSKENNSSDLLNQAFQIINSTWADAKQFDKAELSDYRKIWKNYRPKINSLSSTYGKPDNKKTSKPIYLVPVAIMDWQEFMEKVNAEKYHPLTERLEVLRIAKNLFEKVDSFSELKDEERKFIAGIPNSLNIDNDEIWGYFGSMRGAGLYKKRIIENNQNISSALDEIPISGQITKTHYQRFLYHFTKTFEGNYLATATRLLAMKRPDVFVCLDSKNRSALCKDFGVVQSKLDYDRYWNEIVERTFDSDWWINPKPKDDIEKDVSNSRAAFLDSIYYEE
jgi:hypothetical protein